LLHANSLSLARLTGAAASLLPCPVTAHLRDIVGLSAAAIRDINRNRRLIAVSHAVADAHIRQGLDARLVQVLHNGVDVDQFRPPRPNEDRLAIRRRLRIPDSALLALAVGQIGARKGLDILIAAIWPIMQQEPSLHLAIAGERYSEKAEALDYERRLHDAVREHHIRDRVHWLGYVAEMPDLLRAADLLVHAARQEPFGRVLLEAAAPARCWAMANQRFS
jgi:glycosyltransferase involved in cell wall biosynthesis